MTVITATVLIMCGMQSGTAADFGAFSVSQLQCVIGNNAAAGEHRAGYNGVFQLTAPDAPKNAAKPVPNPAQMAKPSSLFPGTNPGSIKMFGDTEVRIGGQVRYEFGAGR